MPALSCRWRKVVFAVVTICCVSSYTYVWRHVDPLLQPRRLETQAGEAGDRPVFLINLSTEERHRLESKPVHELSTGEPYLSRKRHIAKKCRDLANDSNEVDLSRMVFDDKHKIIMCVVPKAASTTWKRVFWYLLGKVEAKGDRHLVEPEKLVLSKGYIKTLANLTRSEAMERLQTYVTFMVTRHPFERLVSAHSSKFSGRYADSKFRQRLGVRIARWQAKDYMHGVRTKLNKQNLIDDPTFRKLTRDQQLEVQDYVEILKSGKIPFYQFARYLVHPWLKEDTRDVHWRPQVELCNPCAVNYDYVIKFQNLNRDSDRLLEYMQRGVAPDEQIRFDTQTSLINSNRTAQALSTIDKHLLHDLRQLYAQDFSILGYS